VRGAPACFINPQSSWWFARHRIDWPLEKLNLRRGCFIALDLLDGLERARRAAHGKSFTQGGHRQQRSKGLEARLVVDGGQVLPESHMALEAL
jgi:hypothetical protein